MERLSSRMMEKFCQLVATEDMDGADAAYRAGYGRESHPIKDEYHSQVAYRLMQNEKVCLRIKTIRKQLRHDDKDFTTSLICDLKRIIKFDLLQYYESDNVKLQNGRTVTDYYLKLPVQNWSRDDRALMCNGFDAQGRPKFIDKQWAYEKLMKIYGLDGKDTSDIEDILGLYAGAGLPMVSNEIPYEDDESDNDYSEIDAEIDRDLRNSYGNNAGYEDYDEEDYDEEDDDYYYDPYAYEE